jgi:hypothetical protein
LTSQRKPIPSANRRSPSGNFHHFRDGTGGRNFTAVASGGNFIDRGLLELGGGTVTATSIALGGTGTIDGYGVVNGPVTGLGSMEASGGTLNLTAAPLALLSGTAVLAGAALRADAGATLQLANNQSVVSVNGTLTLSDNGSVSSR